MAVTPDLGRWDLLVAARARGEAGDGIASVLALLGLPDLISFAGGFPDPETFPREHVATLFREFADSAEATRSSTRPRAACPARSTRLPEGSTRCRVADPPPTSC